MSYIFGRNSIAGTGRVDYPANTLIVCRFTSGITGTARSMYMYGWLDAGEIARLVIYDISGPPNLLGYTENLPVGIGWNSADLVSQVSIQSGNTYYIGMQVGDNIVGLVSDNNQSNQTRDNLSGSYDASPPDPLPVDEDNYGLRALNIYVDDAWINPPEAEASAAVLLVL